jgi:hypothetical protein
MTTNYRPKQGDFVQYVDRVYFVQHADDETVSLVHICDIEYGEYVDYDVLLFKPGPPMTWENYYSKPSTFELHNFGGYEDLYSLIEQRIQGCEYGIKKYEADQEQVDYLQNRMAILKALHEQVKQAEVNHDN